MYRPKTLVLLGAYLLALAACESQTVSPVSPQHSTDPLSGGGAARVAVGSNGTPQIQASVLSGGIVVIADAALTTTHVAGLEAFSDGNHDEILVDGQARVGERFVGQALSVWSGFSQHDQLGGTATGPLTLVAGTPNRNLHVLPYFGVGISGKTVNGLGPSGFPDGNAIGEGSVAVMFDFDQSEVGFAAGGADGGNGQYIVTFFRRNGTTIGVVGVPSTNGQFAFRTDDGSADIAGFSIHNTDGGGVTYDNFKYRAITNVAPIANAGPDQTVECTGHGTSVGLNGSGSSDADGSIVSYQWYDAANNLVATGATPTVSLGLGTHTLKLVVTDDDGATAADNATITIQDTTAPDVTLSPTPGNLWPPNHQYVSVTLNAAVSDACDGAVTVTATAVSSQADDANGNGDGNTTGDIRVTHANATVSTSSNASPSVSFNPLTAALELRAERAGQGARTYTITLTATDASGNQTVKTATVVVAHDQGN